MRLLLACVVFSMATGCGDDGATRRPGVTSDRVADATAAPKPKPKPIDLTLGAGYEMRECDVTIRPLEVAPVGVFDLIFVADVLAVLLHLGAFAEDELLLIARGPAIGHVDEHDGRLAVQRQLAHVRDDGVVVLGVLERHENALVHGGS